MLRHARQTLQDGRTGVACSGSSFQAATEIALYTASQDALLGLSGVDGLTTSFYRPS